MPQQKRIDQFFCVEKIITGFEFRNYCFRVVQPSDKTSEFTIDNIRLQLIYADRHIITDSFCTLIEFTGYKETNPTGTQQNKHSYCNKIFGVIYRSFHSGKYSQIA